MKTIIILAMYSLFIEYIIFFIDYLYKYTLLLLLITIKKIEKNILLLNFNI